MPRSWVNRPDCPVIWDNLHARPREKRPPIFTVDGTTIEGQEAILHSLYTHLNLAERNLLDGEHHHPDLARYRDRIRRDLVDTIELIERMKGAVCNE